VNWEHVPVTVDPTRFRTSRWSAIGVIAVNRMPGDRAASAKLYRLHQFAVQEIHTLRDALVAAAVQL
jgi:hypothetical protein